MIVSILEKAAAVLSTSTKNPKELRAVAANLFALVKKGYSELAVHFFIVAAALPEVAARVETYRDAAIYAASGSALERQAVAGIVKHADALPDVAARVRAYRVAAKHAVSGSALEQQAIGKLRVLSETKETSPPRPEQIAVCVARFGTPARN